MGFGSIWHWVIVLVVVLLLFGRGKIPELMGDLAKGINSFKRGMKDEDKEAKTIDQQSPSTVSAAEEKSKAS